MIRRKPRAFRIVRAPRPMFPNGFRLTTVEQFAFAALLEAADALTAELKKRAA